MKRGDLYPCTLGDCQNYVPYEQLIWCDTCGCPRCHAHEGCDFCETFRWSCDNCGWESDEGFDVDEPTTLRLVCTCKGFACKNCDVECEYPRCLYEDGQMYLEFENDNPELPF